MSSNNRHVTGTLELNDKGFGHLRATDKNYAARSNDPFVSRELVQRFVMRGGETVTGTLGREARNGSPAVTRVEEISGMPAGAYVEVKPIGDLVPIDPCEALHFETPGGPLSMRVLDLMTPIGKGQRGLIVAPPRTGKTVLLQQIAAGISANHPEAYLLVLLIDERPEEVTEMRRTVHGEVVASSNDHDIASHVRIARLMIERAKRMVEAGQDVVVLLDSLTRLGRAFNANVGTSGRTMSGGLDIRALAEPKSIFGSARNIEGGGSLTIIASALVQTGSRMDEVIFQEFKGTGNMEIVLTRDLSDKRIWPAIDLAQSGTRKEEKLLTPDAFEKVCRIRRRLNGKSVVADMTDLLSVLGRFPDNKSFLAALTPA
jgi:transcription termination factor Rho